MRIDWGAGGDILENTAVSGCVIRDSARGIPYE